METTSISAQNKGAYSSRFMSCRDGRRGENTPSLFVSLPRAHFLSNSSCQTVRVPGFSRSYLESKYTRCITFVTKFQVICCPYRLTTSLNTSSWVDTRHVVKICLGGAEVVITAKMYPSISLTEIWRAYSFITNGHVEIKKKKEEQKNK
jgi:hypothetical protein